MRIVVNSAEYTSRGLEISLKNSPKKSAAFTKELVQALRILCHYFRQGFVLHDTKLIIKIENNAKKMSIEQIQQLFNNLVDVKLQPKITRLNEDYKPLELSQRVRSQPLVVLLHVRGQLPFTFFDAETLNKVLVREVVGPCGEKSPSGYGTLVVKVVFDTNQPNFRIKTQLDAMEKQIIKLFS